MASSPFAQSNSQQNEVSSVFTMRALTKQPNNSVIMSRERHRKRPASHFDDVEVILLIDHRELNGTSSRIVLDRALERASIQYEERRLPVADILWIVKRDNEEYVAPYLVERKTTFDLSRSIREPSKRYPPLTRVEIQMIKMKSSGIANKVYLVEGKVTESNKQYLETLRRNHDDFTVECTDDLQGTIAFLIRQHQRVVDYARRNQQTTSLTYDDLVERIEEVLDDPTFKWRLRILNMNGIGKLESTAIVKQGVSNRAEI